MLLSGTVRWVSNSSLTVGYFLRGVTKYNPVVCSQLILKFNIEDSQLAGRKKGREKGGKERKEEGKKERKGINSRHYTLMSYLK